MNIISWWQKIRRVEAYIYPDEDRPGAYEALTLFKYGPFGLLTSTEHMVKRGSVEELWAAVFSIITVTGTLPMVVRFDNIEYDTPGTVV